MKKIVEPKREDETGYVENFLVRSSKVLTPH
jgi:hypothetical protein